MELTTWLRVPAVGGLIGYMTNRLAVKMIFRPIQPVNILGLRIQGLMPRRQQDMARSIGAVVGDHLVSHQDLAKGLADFDMAALLTEIPQPSEGDLRERVTNLCRCGTYGRIRRAVLRAAEALREEAPEDAP